MVQEMHGTLCRLVHAVVVAPSFRHLWQESDMEDDALTKLEVDGLGLVRPRGRLREFQQLRVHHGLCSPWLRSQQR